MPARHSHCIVVILSNCTPGSWRQARNPWWRKPGGKLVWWDCHNRTATSKLILTVGLDGHIRGGIGDAGEAESLAHLVVIQERLVALVNAALKHLASAAGARSSTAGVGQFQAFLLSLIQDVHVLRALEGLRAIRGLEGHLEVGWHSGTSGHSVHDGWHIACCQCAFGQGLAAQVHTLLRCHKGVCAGGQEAAQQGRTAGRNHQERQHTRLRSHCLRFVCPKLPCRPHSQNSLQSCFTSHTVHTNANNRRLKGVSSTSSTAKKNVSETAWTRL